MNFRNSGPYPQELESGGPRGRFWIQRSRGQGFELDASTGSKDSLDSSQQKRWETEAVAVELDGTGVR